MKRIISFLFFTALFTDCLWAQNVTCRISDGINDSSLKNAVEQNISTLLTNINLAAQQKTKEVSMDSVKITQQAAEAFNRLWRNKPFRCVDNMIVERCKRMVSGFVVRGIPVTLLSKENSNDTMVKELTICLGPLGEIGGVFFSLEPHLTSNIIPYGLELKDLDRREEILSFIERYCSCFDQGSLKPVERAYNEEAFNHLFEEQGKSSETDSTKALWDGRYLNKISDLFSNQAKAEISIKKIEVIRHPMNDRDYLVHLYQQLYVDGYVDRGCLSLSWHFANEDYSAVPSIWCWQSEENLEKGDLIKVEDFSIH